MVWQVMCLPLQVTVSPHSILQFQRLRARSIRVMVD